MIWFKIRICTIIVWVKEKYDRLLSDRNVSLAGSDYNWCQESARTWKCYNFGQLGHIVARCPKPQFSSLPVWFGRIPMGGLSLLINPAPAHVVEVRLRRIEFRSVIKDEWLKKGERSRSKFLDINSIAAECIRIL